MDAGRKLLKGAIISVLAATAVFAVLALTHVIPIWLAVLCVIVFIATLLINFGLVAKAESDGAGTRGTDTSEKNNKTSRRGEKQHRPRKRGFLRSLFR